MKKRPGNARMVKLPNQSKVGSIVFRRREEERRTCCGKVNWFVHKKGKTSTRAPKDVAEDC